MRYMILSIEIRLPIVTHDEKNTEDKKQKLNCLKNFQGMLSHESMFVQMLCTYICKHSLSSTENHHNMTWEFS